MNNAAIFALFTEGSFYIEQKKQERAQSYNRHTDHRAGLLIYNIHRSDTALSAYIHAHGAVGQLYRRSFYRDYRYMRDRSYSL